MHTAEKMKYQLNKNDQGEILFEFDEDNQLFAYWLKNNYTSSNTQDLDTLIQFVEKIQAGRIDDYQISRNSYYLQLTSTSAKIIGLSTLDAPNEVTDNKMDVANPLENECRLDTFLTLLKDWQTLIH
ncbi:MAG: YacL family protein [Cellvibrionales bacterium]|nr:YacL family protein [Cellvibrionales bacterium]